MCPSNENTVCVCVGGGGVLKECKPLLSISPQTSPLKPPKVLPRRVRCTDKIMKLFLTLSHNLSRKAHAGSWTAVCRHFST